MKVYVLQAMGRRANETSHVDVGIPYGSIISRYCFSDLHDAEDWMVTFLDNVTTDPDGTHSFTLEEEDLAFGIAELELKIRE